MLAFFILGTTLPRQPEIDQDLPDDIQEQIEGEHEATEEQIAALTATIVGKRNDAIAARKTSGIEEAWMVCEEAYVGIDDANRSEFASAKWAKPTSMEGPVTTNYAKTDNTRSNAYVRLTSRYVDAGAARVAEILLPIDDKAFSIDATPLPHLVNGRDDARQVQGPDGQPLYRDQTPEELAQEQLQQQAMQPQAGQSPAAPTQAQPTAQTPSPTGSPPAPQTAATATQTATAPAPTKVPLTVADYAKAQLDAAEDAADKAETRIYDWMVKCNYPAETRKVIFDSARIGVGVLKGPIPDIEKSQAFTKDGDIGKLEIVEKVAPVVKWIDPWNFYPDESCGENIHDGEGCFEKDKITAKVLRGLKKQKGYIAEAIEKVLKQGPGKNYEDGQNPNEKDAKNKKNLFEIWYWYGTLNVDDMAALNESAVQDLPEDQDEVYAIITMVNDVIIRATLNPMDSGRFPYNVFPWSRRPSSWAGVGIAEQISLPQRITNAATRALLNNAGVSAGPQIIIDLLSIKPYDGKWEFRPNKIWINTGENPIEDASKSFSTVEFPNIGPQLMEVINYGFKLAEEQSNIPVMAQGQISDKLPDTFGAAELLNTNANTLLRKIGYSYDDHITEPVVKAFYEWLLLDPEVPDDEKGDFKINAHGSSALVERAIQEQTLVQVGQMSLQAAYKIDPSKWVREWLRSKRLDPRKFQYTDQQIEQMESTPPPPPIPLQVAQIKAQSAMQVEQAKAQADQQLAQDKAQREAEMQQQEDQREQAMLSSGQATPHQVNAQAKIEAENIKAQSQERLQASKAQAEQAYAATEAQTARENAAAELQKLQLQRELAMLQYANQNKISLDQMQADLAKTSLIEQTKRQVAAVDVQAKATENAMDRQHDMVKHVTSLIAGAQPQKSTGEQQ